MEPADHVDLRDAGGQGFLDGRDDIVDGALEQWEGERSSSRRRISNP
jgi:hypothetical protein